MARVVWSPRPSPVWYRRKLRLRPVPSSVDAWVTIIRHASYTLAQRWDTYKSIQNGARRNSRLLAEVVRLVTGLPLYVATDTGFLVLVNRFVSKDSVERGPQVATGDRYSIPRPAVIQLTAVDQFPETVKDKEIRCARRRVTPGRLLRFVIEEWKSETKLL